MGVRETIIEAFAKTPYPGDDNIAAPNWDDEGTTEYFRGKDWRGRSPKDLRQYASSLSFFTPDAFRFFLPAFMLAELDDPETADIIAESIAFDFTQALSREDRIRQFAKPELAAIAAFFDECAQRYLTFDYEYQWAAAEVRRFLGDA